MGVGDRNEKNLYEVDVAKLGMGMGMGTSPIPRIPAPILVLSILSPYAPYIKLVLISLKF